MVFFDVNKLEEIIRSQPSFKGVKGSIVRLKINNFMTYHKVELRAGPNVNLILGPNGTGKSTIVCAICIGLAGKPKILGRASSLKEYIRHDCDSASVEIELYNPNGHNFVVKRSIKATHTGASSTWLLNGKKAAQPAVEKLLSDLNIQLDNLCQFLPQDRVQEFSKMDGYSLLRSTQQAMGKDTLIERHDRLIKLNDLIKQIDNSVRNSSTALREEQQNNQRLENEVKNYHERERFKKQIADLKGKKAWINYLKAMKVFSELNAELETLKKKKKEEENKLQPMRRSVQQMDAKLVKLQQEMNHCRSANLSLLTAVKRKYEDECDKVEVRVHAINYELEAQEKSERDRQRRVDTATDKLNSLVNELEKFNGIGYNSDLLRLEQDVKRIGEEVAKCSELIYKVTEENNTDKQEVNGLKERMRQWNAEMVKLGDLKVSRLKFLQRERKDAAQAIEFFKDPQILAKLKGKIHDPMILSICVNDLKYGPIVERHIGISDMTSFFCENADDLQVMLELTKPQGYRISIIHHTAPPDNWVKPPPTLKPDFLKRYSFQKTLIELIQAPDYYFSYMVKKHRVQDIPVGTSPTTDERYSEITAKTQISAFYTDQNSYFIKKSAYGSGTCASIDFLPAARVFTTEINAAERERLEGLVQDANRSRIEIEARIKERENDLQKLEENRRDKENELKEARTKVDYRKGLNNKILQARKTKEQLETDIPNMAEMREKTTREVWEEREKLVGHLEWSVTEIEKNTKKGQKFIVLKRQVNVLQTRINTKKTNLEELESSINQHNGSMRTLSEQTEHHAGEATRAKTEAVEVSGLQTAPPDVAQGTLTVDGINREITQAESQMRFLVDTDASIVKDYEERLKKIEKLSRERGASVEKLAEIKKDMELKKKEWLDPLQDLINRINNNFGTFFANMGCAGEVSLCPGEDENDFAKYGIKIMVKFRNSEPLAEMCGTRVGTLQSGGERVITTALYVLALQELTVVPFRVIDEINQGMDAKNESRFFNLLCSMAKGQNTPQYFLLTPKTLPPVDYPDNVDFHFIMNGPKVSVPYDSSDEDGDDDEEMEDDDSEED